MAATRLPFSGQQYWNACKKTSYPGAKMFTYNAGFAFDIPKATYTNSTETVQHSNPIIADKNGIFPEIYGTGRYDIVIRSSLDDELIYEADDVYVQNDTSPPPPQELLK